jgi:hypothetical protein
MQHQQVGDVDEVRVIVTCRVLEVVTLVLHMALAYPQVVNGPRHCRWSSYFCLLLRPCVVTL